jgi:hypothetical protein
MLSTPPVAARRGGDAFDVGGCGRDEIAGIEAAAIGVFGAGIDLGEGLDVGEARLSRVFSIRTDPVDIAASRIGARLDAAVALLDGGFRDELAGRRVPEIHLDIPFQGRLIALEGERIVGLAGHDFVGDLDLAAHGVDGDERAFELMGSTS